jgi:hypothetical protein
VYGRPSLVAAGAATLGQVYFGGPCRIVFIQDYSPFIVLIEARTVCGGTQWHLCMYRCQKRPNVEAKGT